MPERDSQSKPSSARSTPEALGQAESFLTFQEQLSRVARVDRPVLLIGERGTGKELAAMRLHFLSTRWQEPFVALNCAALAATLIESELFGHEEGAFTGAGKRRSGRFEAANQGSLFLDEIGNIPVETQEKILRVVEYGSFERVGSSRSIQVDARIIGATNCNLTEQADQGLFMRDLLDRLSFEVLFIPPLRERREDIMLLSNHYASRMAYELGRPDMPQFTERAEEKLESYAWPGNVRELKNVVERAVYRSDDAIITDVEIVFDPFRSPFALEPCPPPPVISGHAPKETVARRSSALDEVLDGRTYDDVIRDVELTMLRGALDRARFNQRRAADLMGLTYHQFRGLYRKYTDQLGE